MHELQEALNWLFGVGQEARDAEAWKIALRALLMYLGGLAVVRLGQSRFLGQNTVFDAILVVILGSVISRAINGGSSISGAIAASIALILLHWLLAYLSFKSHVIGNLVKGRDLALITDGRRDEDAIHHSYTSDSDLLEAVRQQANMNDTEVIRDAVLERSGEISIIPKKEVKLLEVKIENGVQILRIEINS